MNNDSINPETKEILEEHVGWINQVTELAAKDDWKAVAKAINNLRDDQTRGMIYVLVLARAGDATTLRQLISSWNAAPLN